MESTITTINLLPLGKEQIEDFANKTISEVKAGNVNALELKAKLKAIEKAIELIDKGTREEQMNEMAKHGKEAEMLGFKIEQAELGTKYDYSKCNDLRLNEFYESKNLINECIKDRENFLKLIKKHETFFIEETGEVINIYPPIKTSTTGLKFTLK